MVLDPAWVLALVLDRAATDKTPAKFADTYASTAAAIAKVASASPLPGHTVEETAAEIVSVAWFESHFQPDAVGDCTDAKNFPVSCRKPGATPHSFCAVQINETNFRGYGTTRAEVLGSIERCLEIGLRIMRDSYRVCAGRPAGEKLAFYAAGGYGCSTKKDATAKSSHRVLLGRYLWKRGQDLKAKKEAEKNEAMKKPESDAGE